MIEESEKLDELLISTLSFIMIVFVFLTVLTLGGAPLPYVEVLAERAAGLLGFGDIPETLGGLKSLIFFAFAGNALVGFYGVFLLVRGLIRTVRKTFGGVRL
ncbi:MAG TPA: hypothetical protein ENJ61_00350 [Aquifex aeolicus]|uniref:Uncharacterized protein n=1 Tax=Aquifex aeolicus TaxID=63363 RepID=A0A7C5PYD9_AQUAO|nr:hypothetical protein [Aquifex aeolicus]